VIDTKLFLFFRKQPINGFLIVIAKIPFSSSPRRPIGRYDIKAYQNVFFMKALKYKNISIIVPGGLNTDIIAHNIDKLLKKSELSYGGTLKIGPGGKSRNIAQMAAQLLGKSRIAMIGITVKDPYGLWKIPLKALKKAGVNTDYVRIENFNKRDPQFPGVALIPVDRNGNNQIYVLPGINEKLSKEHIIGAERLFKSTSGRILILSMEIPKEAAVCAIQMAYENSIKIILDPGGINSRDEIDDLINEKIFLLKPNEHEARIITGVSIQDFGSANRAARRILRRGVQNVLITHGERGAYLFSASMKEHIPVPEVTTTAPFDETGCGDQATATIAVMISEGYDLMRSSVAAVKAGTLQYHRIGIQPVLRKDIL
jgi:ribokinase